MATEGTTLTLDEVRDINTQTGRLTTLLETMVRSGNPTVISRTTRDDFFFVLERFETQAVHALRMALIAGEVNGYSYMTCIGGRLAQGESSFAAREDATYSIAGAAHTRLRELGLLASDVDGGAASYCTCPLCAANRGETPSAAARAFSTVESEAFNLTTGDNADVSVNAALLVDWVDEYLSQRAQATQPQPVSQEAR